MRIPVAMAFSFLSITAFGQITTTRAADGSSVSLLNEPFSADAVTTLVRTLPDGTHITRETTGKMYRDSEGRSRTDRTPGQFMAGQPAPPGAGAPPMGGAPQQMAPPGGAPMGGGMNPNQLAMLRRQQPMSQ